MFILLLFLHRGGLTECFFLRALHLVFDVFGGQALLLEFFVFFEGFDFAAAADLDGCVDAVEVVAVGVVFSHVDVAFGLAAPAGFEGEPFDGCSEVVVFVFVSEVESEGGGCEGSEDESEDEGEFDSGADDVESEDADADEGDGEEGDVFALCGGDGYGEGDVGGECPVACFSAEDAGCVDCFCFSHGFWFLFFGLVSCCFYSVFWV